MKKWRGVMQKTSFFLGLVLLASGFLFVPADASAQSDTSGVLEEVIVTARKRFENLQLVPDTVVAFSADTIEQANMVMVRDVTSMIPNVSIEESLSPTSTFIGIRGVISTRNGEPAVAMVVDGVQIGNASEVSQAFFDVESIEVLKGPQGALYGRNAIGGAILITSKPPTDEFSGKITGGIGNSDLMEAFGHISGPISDDWKFRISGNFRDFDGTILNEYLNELASGANITSADNWRNSSDAYTDFETNKDVRGQLFWTPGDMTAVDLLISYSDLETGSYWYRPSVRLETSNDYIDFPIGNDVNTVAFRTIFNTTLKIQHEMSFATLTSITAYTDTDERYGVPYSGRGSNQMGDVDFMNRTFVARAQANLDPLDAALLDTQLQGVGSHNFYKIKNFSQEIRFTSHEDERFRWVAGAYLLTTNRPESIVADLTIPGSLPLSARLPNGLPGVTDFATISGLLFDTSNKQKNTAWALFASTDFDITDQLVLTAALRYDQDKRKITRLDGPTVNTGGEGVGSSVFGAECTVGVGGCVPKGFTEKKTFSALQPKVSLAYQATDDLMVYGTYARGFRSGGFNASGALLAETYDKEILDSFELGLKSTWLDNTLRVNTAIFHQKYDDVQVFEFDGAIFVQSLYTIPKSRINGFEITVDWAATDSLTFSVGLGLLDSKIKEFNSVIRDRLEEQLNLRIANTVKLTPDTQREFDNNFEGNKLIKFPHTSANASVVYARPISWFGGSNFVGRIDYNLTADRYWWIDNTDKQPNVSLFKASLALQFTDQIEAILWCKNCTDKFYDYSFEPAEMVLFGGPSKDIFYQARERTWGVRLAYTF
jgi:iron complex outermembrane receptor protein